MRLALAILAALFLAFAGAGLHAKEAVPASADPVLEKKAMRLADELRCLVCQNQTIADSNAGLAMDLKQQIRDQLKQGRSEQQILDFMVQRYGDFVLYRPPLKAITLFLWIGPFLLLAGAGLGLFFYLGRRRKTLSERSMSEEQHARAGALLGTEGDPK